MMFVICKKIDDDLSVPLINNEGNLVMFDNELDANIERIYLQPDHVKRLIVYPSKLGANNV